MAKRNWQTAIEVEDKTEPRVTKQLDRAFAKMQDRVSITQLAIAITGKDVKRAVEVLPEDDTRDMLAPTAETLRQTFLKGGRVGATLLNEEADGL